MISTEDGFHLSVGELVQRETVHEMLGGRLHGRISPSKTPQRAVMFFGGEGGLAWDGEGEDGLLYLMGEGFSGDQSFTQSNRRVLEHQRNGCQIFGFWSDGDGDYRYIGRFLLNDVLYVDVPGKDKVDRQAIVFRLRFLDPDGSQFVNNLDESLPESLAMGVSDHLSERLIPQDSFSERRGDLYCAFKDFVLQKNGVPQGLRISLEDDWVCLSPDLYDARSHDAVIVVDSVCRSSLLLAAARLKEMKSLSDEIDHLTIVAPARPRDSLVQAVNGIGVSIVYRMGDSWLREGRFYDHGDLSEFILPR